MVHLHPSIKLTELAHWAERQGFRLRALPGGHIVVEPRAEADETAERDSGAEIAEIAEIAETSHTGSIAGAVPGGLEATPGAGSGPGPRPPTMPPRLPVALSRRWGTADQMNWHGATHGASERVG